MSSGGRNKRVMLPARTAGGVTTEFLVDTLNPTGYSQVLEEVEDGGVTRRYTYGLDLVSQEQSSGVSFYGYDGHGSVRILTDVTGAVTDSYAYDAFGNLSGRTGRTENLYMYGGERLDEQLGLYYLRARYFSYFVGRFESRDLFEGFLFDPPSLHTYSYATANPINEYDPSGRLSLPEVSISTAIQGVLRTIRKVRAFFTIKKAKDRVDLVILSARILATALNPEKSDFGWSMVFEIDSDNKVSLGCDYAANVNALRACDVLSLKLESDQGGSGDQGVSLKYDFGNNLFEASIEAGVERVLYKSGYGEIVAGISLAQDLSAIGNSIGNGTIGLMDAWPKIGLGFSYNLFNTGLSFGIVDLELPGGLEFFGVDVFGN